MAGHDHTKAAIFADPVSGSIKWRDIESLLKSLGAQITEGRGSRVRIFLNGHKATFHRPRPSPNTDKGSVRSVRRFLTAAGIKP